MRIIKGDDVFGWHSVQCERFFSEFYVSFRWFVILVTYNPCREKTVWRCVVVWCHVGGRCGLCEKGRFWLACASAQTDQNIPFSGLTGITSGECKTWKVKILVSLGDVHELRVHRMQMAVGSLSRNASDKTFRMRPLFLRVLLFCRTFLDKGPVVQN